MIDIVLIDTKFSGNVGAIARVMANFEIKNLVLINPQCDYKDKEAMDRASHAKDILLNAKVKKLSVLKKYDYSIATTGRMGTDYNIKRSPVLPKDLAKKISKKNKVAIVFGSENYGLKNEEIELCDYAVTIPTSKSYHSMNLSHAVAIILYELYSQNTKDNITTHITPMSKVEKEVITQTFNEILDKIQFATKEKKETQNIVWEKMFSKSHLSKREAYALIGGLKKIRDKLKK